MENLILGGPVGKTWLYAESSNNLLLCHGLVEVPDY